jgi:branched-chain amino acid transport system substrate-binding protein
MRQQGLTIPVVGGAAGYVIPDFAKALGQYAEGVLSIAPANYDLAPEFTDRYRKRFGSFMVHEALEHAVCMSVLAQAIEKAASMDSGKVREALRATKFTDGWAKAMTGGAVKFDDTGLNTLAEPVMVQWRNKELVTVYPKSLAKGDVVLSS